jgi:Ion channel
MKSYQFPRYSFQGLFFTLVALLLVPAFFKQNFELVHNLVWSTSLLAGVWLVTHERRMLVIGTLLGIPCMVLTWLSLPEVSTNWALAYTLISAIFLIFILGHLLYFVVEAQRVSSDLIFASLCTYLLIGLVWAHAYVIMELFVPGAFAINSDSSSTLPQLFIYYSFVTLTTLGYGDVVPVIPFAQSWAAMEAVMGQLYLAIVVARLMGLYIGRELARNLSEDK